MVDRWPLAGRTEELRVVSEALAAADGGIVIAGQAGVGKTRLAQAAADAAQRSGWWLQRIAGTATGRPIALSAFARWADAPEGSALTLARSVFAGLAADAGDARTLLFVDDAHLLDDISALIVHQLVLQNSAVVMATIRTGEQAPDAVTALWKNGLLRRLELQPLSHNESDALLSTVLDGPVDPASATRMWKLSRGNVLYLNHLVEHERDADRLVKHGDEWHWPGTAAMSPSLIDLVDMQIGAVSDDVREIVDMVAIAEPLDRHLLATLADHQAIETAERQGLIATGADSDSVYIGHPLYGEIRLSQCGPIRLRRLHARLASAMADASDPDPVRLGLYWLESDLPPDVEVLSTAAAICASRLDLQLAERLARAAVAAHPSPATKLQLAYTLNLQEKATAVEELLDTLAPDALTGSAFVDGVILRAANLLFALRNPDASRVVIDEALQLGDPARNQSLLTFRAIAQAMAAQPAETIATMAEVDYDRLDPHGAVLGLAAEAIALGDLGRVALAGERAALGYRMLAQSPQESFHASGLAEFHANALLAAGYVADAMAVAERGYRAYADLPGLSSSMAVAALGVVALGSGDLAAARRHLDAARLGFGEYGEVSGLWYRFRITHTEVLARSGRHDGAETAFAAMHASRHPSYQYVESLYLLASAWVAGCAGRISEARETCLRAAEFARSHSQWAREVLCLQSAVQLGDASMAARSSELAALVEGPRAAVAARYAHALSAGDGPALDDVSTEWERVGDVLAAADAAAQAVVAHREAGRRGSALTSGERAFQLAERCGGAVSPALAAARVPLPFTPREREITELLSQGLSNKDIAEATSLSVRTVESYVYQASSKAGVSSRSELSTLVRQYRLGVKRP